MLSFFRKFSKRRGLALVAAMWMVFPLTSAWGDVTLEKKGGAQHQVEHQLHHQNPTIGLTSVDDLHESQFSEQDCSAIDGCEMTCSACIGGLSQPTSVFKLKHNGPPHNFLWAYLPLESEELPLRPPRY